MPALQRWFAGYFSLTEISLRLAFRNLEGLFPI
jgi:hypothetical protein